MDAPRTLRRLSRDASRPLRRALCTSTSSEQLDATSGMVFGGREDALHGPVTLFGSLDKNLAVDLDQRLRAGCAGHGQGDRCDWHFHAHGNGPPAGFADWEGLSQGKLKIA